MMPKIKVFRFLPIVFAAGCAVGCSRSGSLEYRVTIVPTIQARVSALAFEPGDRIGLSIFRDSELCTENWPMTYVGTMFTDGPEWNTRLQEPLELVAYYPYSVDGVSDRFSVAADQRAGCGASDLLGAVASGVVPGPVPVKMVFQHLMAQLTVLVDNHTASPVETVVLEGFARTADVDLKALAVAARPDAEAEVYACEVQPGVSYRAMLVPQQADLTVAVTAADGTVYRKTFRDAALESGHCYDLTVELTESGAKMLLSGEVRDWIDGGTIGSGSEDPDEEDPGTLVYEGETYAAALVGERFWMAENLRFRPETAEIGAGVRYPEEGASGVAAKGLLYDLPTALGADALGSERVRGICPPGWHIPDRAELEALAAGECEEGFFCFPGCWIATTSKYGTASYLMSTALSAQNTKMTCLKLSPDGAHSFVSVPVQYGVSLRCVKDE